jgi:hypothetical protein
MGLLRGLLSLPVSGPMRGALWIASKIHEAAEAEHTDPAAIRHALRDLEAALEAGEIDEESFEAAELELLSRLSAGRRREQA